MHDSSLVVHFIIVELTVISKEGLCSAIVLSWRWLFLYRRSLLFTFYLGKNLRVLFGLLVSQTETWFISLTNELLLCVGCCSTCWEYSSGQNRQKPWMVLTVRGNGSTEGGSGEVIHTVSKHRLQPAYLLRAFTHKGSMLQIFGMVDDVNFYS